MLALSFGGSAEKLNILSFTVNIEKLDNDEKQVMKKGWTLNIILLAIVASLVAFLYLRPKNDVTSPEKYEVSQLKLGGIDAVKVEFPTKAPVQFKKTDGFWHMLAPYKLRADQLSVQRILAVVAATSENKFPSTDLIKFGLDKPQLKVVFTGENIKETFVYGTYNPISDDQYVLFRDNIYLLGSNYSEAASTQVIEMIDKAPLGPAERKQVAGFDFSRLEQWEEAGLKVDIKGGTWNVNIAEAKTTQNEMNEWMEFSWKQNPSKEVEIYTPDRNMTYPSFKVTLKNGQKVHFDKISEAPDLLLARPDEGLIYHFSNDVGFTMLNPPLNLQ